MAGGSGRCPGAMSRQARTNRILVCTRCWHGAIRIALEEHGRESEGVAGNESTPATPRVNGRNNFLIVSAAVARQHAPLINRAGPELLINARAATAAREKKIAGVPLERSALSLYYR